MERLIGFIDAYFSICLAIIVLGTTTAVYFYRRFKVSGAAVKVNKAFLKYGIFVTVSLLLLGCARWINLPSITGAWFYVAGILFLAFPIADWYLTRLALRYGAVESNPAMNLLISKIGIDNAIMVIVPLVAIAASVTLSMNTAYFLTIVVIYTFIVINNLFALRKARQKTMTAIRSE